jgi:hypothetical protein
LLEHWGFEHGALELTRSDDVRGLAHTILAVVCPDAERVGRVTGALSSAA